MNVAYKTGIELRRPSTGSTLCLGNDTLVPWHKVQDMVNEDYPGWVIDSTEMYAKHEDKLYVWQGFKFPSREFDLTEPWERMG